MCGIVGFISDTYKMAERLKIIRKIGLLQYHRGPDYWGEFEDDNVTFGHNRLAILDLSSGDQPMTDSTGIYTIIFNGEIYNYLELKSILLEKGYVFLTQNSDTEVILNGFKEWGTKLFNMLNGMFAFSLYDRLNQNIFLVRDRIGIKPIYYYQDDNSLIFCSEPKGLYTLPFLKKEINIDSIPEYFHSRAAIGRNTLFKEIFKVLPGSYICYSLTDKNVTEVSYLEKKANAKTEDISMGLDTLLHRSVDMHLISDVPVGLFLSGGVDSSLIAYYAQKINSNIKAFNIGVQSNKDETPFASKVSETLDIDLFTKYVSGDDFLGELDDWSYFNDDPVADPSGLALMILSKYANENNFKVMLAGEGADELFGGYYSYSKFLLYKKFLRFLPGIIKKSNIFSRLRLDDYIDKELNPHCSFLGTAQITNFKEKQKLLKNSESIKPFYSLFTSNKTESISSLNGALLNDQLFRLPDDLLPRTDRATMAHSIEARVPFIENNVIDYSRQLADKDLINLVMLKGKVVVKKLSLKYLPREITNRKKIGFELPIINWIKEDLKEVIDKKIENRSLDFINYEFIKESVGQIKNPAMIWAWLILENWNERWIKNNGSVNPRLNASETIHSSYRNIM